MVQRQATVTLLRPHDRRVVLLHRGEKRLGIYQRPGCNMIKMRNDVLTNMLGCQLVDGAGHWVQQEKVGALLVEFLERQTAWLQYSPFDLTSTAKVG
jgi:hypothetical protein